MLELPFKGSYRISQKFGENLNSLYQESGMLGHNGIDYAMPNGTEIISPCDGEVVSISKDVHRGLGVVVMSDDIFRSKNIECKLACTLWHLQKNSIVVEVGDKVKTGQKLAFSNNTGRSTGPHLHFGVTPYVVSARRKKLEPGNGYNGAVDPTQYLVTRNSHVRIKELQALLNVWGSALAVDGKLGPLTRGALNEFLTPDES